ncbi:hypothetical protein BHQ18_06635 [Mycolicibacterium flavescens]|uniref:Uncharacterized protein n=1 Tax=Mycolicibacterium flavescens TaxID=1776 RepID=A0A1E3RMF2_MYCFV|nr:hypothetical protein BHQ18_06635 [Mycolicibacterium flavescens]
MQPRRAGVTQRVCQALELVDDDAVAIQRDDGNLDDSVSAEQACGLDVYDGNPVGLTQQRRNPARAVPVWLYCELKLCVSDF